MNTLFNDIKFACRILAKRPGFTAIALVTLALGIGVNTIMFSIVNALALRPVSVKEPERLVKCKSSINFYPWFMPEVFRRIRAENTIFTDIMAYSAFSDCALRLGNITKPGQKVFVSSNYLSVLGVKPAIGRDFLLTEERPGTETVGILSHRTWQALGADPNVVGKLVSINGFPCRIVGITPEGFSGPTLFGGSDILLPLGAHINMLSELQQQQLAEDPSLRSVFSDPTYLDLIARLKSGLSISTAQTHFRAMAPTLMEFFPDFMQMPCKYWLLQPLPRFHIGSSDSRFGLYSVYTLIIGAGLALLCITCLNLANMIIIQGQSRHREIAVRMALGSSRMRIVRQFLIEALLLVFLGGALGMIMAFWGMKLLNSSIERPRELHVVQFVLDANVLLAGLGSCIIATLLSGLWPAIHSSKHDIISKLKTGQSGTTWISSKMERLRLSRLSLTGQISLSVVLLVGAALFIHSALRALCITPGFSFEGKLAADIDFRVEGNKQADRQQLCRQLISHMQSLPEIQAAGLCTRIPFGGVWSSSNVDLMDTGSNAELLNPADGISCLTQDVSGDYFQAVGLPLLQGRSFTLAECTNDSKVAIVDEQLAFQLRPDGNVLGCFLREYRRKGYREIVGIVPNVRHHVLSEQTESHVYYPLSNLQTAHVVLRVVDPIVGNEKNLIERIRKEISKVNPCIAVTSVGRLSDRHRSGIEMWTAHMFAGLFLFFGSAALFVATLGIYGIKGYMVATRIPEFGIRRALGATGVNIIALVLLEGWNLMLIGLTTGIVSSLALLYVFGNLFFKKVLCDVKPIDPASISVAIILVMLTTLLAGYIPARRAAKIDPMEALRYE